MKKLYVFMIGALVVLLTPPALAQGFKSQAEASANLKASVQRQDQRVAESRAKDAAKHQEFKERVAEIDTKSKAQMDLAKQQRGNASTNASSPATNKPTTPLRGTTDYDVSAVEADRASKAARLAQTKSNAPKDGECIIRPVMSDADIKRCR